MVVMLTGQHPSMQRQQESMILPHKSLHICYILSRTITPVKVTYMQGQKCLSNLVTAKLPLARTIAPLKGFVCTPSIMAIQ